MKEARLRTSPPDVLYKNVFGKSSDWVLFWPLDKYEHSKNVENF